MNDLIQSVEKWAWKRGLSDPYNSPKQMLKVMEEVGETAKALAEGNHHELKDGIGDVVVTLIILAMQNELGLEECLQSAYDEIKARTGKTINGVFIKD